MNMVPCPNGGRCGSHNHRVGSEAYGRCVQIATGDSYKSPFVRLTNTPRNAGSGNDITLSGMTKTLKRSGAYVQADSPVFSEVSLNSRQVQDYIDNPQSVSFNDKQESLINEGIQHYIGDILDDAGIDIDELSPEEVDIACQAAYRAMSKKDALNCVAEKTVRTFSYDCVDNSPNAAKVFDKRGSTYEDGSDEWYSALADAYLDDMTVEYGLYNGRSEADRQAIASALKEAFSMKARITLTSSPASMLFGPARCVMLPRADRVLKASRFSNLMLLSLTPGVLVRSVSPFSYLASTKSISQTKSALVKGGFLASGMKHRISSARFSSRWTTPARTGPRSRSTSTHNNTRQ